MTHGFIHHAHVSRFVIRITLVLASIAFAGVAALTVSKSATSTSKNEASASVKVDRTQQGGLVTPNINGGTKLSSPASGSVGGPKIVFGSVRNGGNHDIFVMDQDGGNQVRLTNNPAYDDQPKWSPDGSKIVFMSDRDGNFEIY